MRSMSSDPTAQCEPKAVQRMFASPRNAVGTH